MSQIKTDQEIQKIQQACRITDRIFGRLRKFISHSTSSEARSPGDDKRINSYTSPHHRSSKWQAIQWQITEKQLETRLLDQIKQVGCKPSFHPIIAAGANAAHPHWRADHTVLHGFVVIDFGVVYQKYMSDMTRTIYVWTPSNEERKLYQLVLNSQQDSMAYIKPGRYYKDAHRVAAATLWSEKEYFIHSLWHGLGTIIHEQPRISAKGKWYFKKNMCITVEPGVYYEEKLWIRIEDTCVVGETDCLPLTKTTKKLVYFT